MTTRLKQLLEQKGASPLFDPKGDEERDAAWYYTANLECLFPLIARAAVQDGVSPETVMKFLVRTAFETLIGPLAKPGEGREIGALIVEEAQRLYSTYPSPEEIEELKRETAAWRAANPHHTTKRQTTRTTH